MATAYQSLLSFSLGKGSASSAQRGRDRRGSSDSSSTGSTSSIYEARPVSSRSISPCEIVVVDDNGGSGSGKLATIVEQKSILRSEDGEEEPWKSKPEEGEGERESVLSDPYDMDEADITYEDFMRYYGSPTAPLVPVSRPPELPPIPQGTTVMIGGRLAGSGARPWRPPVSGYRTFGNMSAHPFHNAPIAEVMESGRRASSDGYGDNIPLLGRWDDGRPLLERWGVWKILSAVGCCFACFGPRESIDD